MSKRGRIYSLYDGDSLETTGTSKELAQKLNVAASTIYNCWLLGYTLKNKYRVKLETDYEREYDRVKRHLRLYGNTSIVRWRQKIVDDLEAEGYKLKITKYEPFKNKRKGNGHLDDMGDDWVIEVLNGKEKKES